jgi:hypothetical protein
MNEQITEAVEAPKTRVLEGKPLNLESIKLNHTYTYVGNAEIEAKLKGQEKIIVDLAKGLGKFLKTEIVAAVDAAIRGTTRQNGLIVFNYYQLGLVSKGFLTIEKAKKEPKPKVEKAPKPLKAPKTAKPGKAAPKALQLTL